MGALEDIPAALHESLSTQGTQLGQLQLKVAAVEVQVATR